MLQQILSSGEAQRVVRMEYKEKESKVLIRVEETPVLWPHENCPYCASKKPYAANNYKRQGTNCY
jgi:hypothetical protein